MSDILDRLRKYAEEKSRSAYDYGDGPMLLEAVAEIERLREIEKEHENCSGWL